METRSKEEREPIRDRKGDEAGAVRPDAPSNALPHAPNRPVEVPHRPAEVPRKPLTEGPHTAAIDGPQQSADVLPNVLIGTLERVTYNDAQSLYSVLRIAPEAGQVTPTTSSMFRAALVTAVGRADAPSSGMRVRLTGRWSAHPAHGPQFEFELLELLPPIDRTGLIKYLASSKFHGVGEKLAGRIVDALGDNALEEILAHPEKLSAVRGLKPAVREALVAAALAEAGTHRANVFLRGLGLGPWQTSAILRKLGPDAEACIRADPYVLASGIAGIGFGTADRMAAGLGLAPDDPRRLRAGVLHALKLASDDGHSLLPRARLIDAAQTLLAHSTADENIAEILRELEARGELVVEHVDAGSSARATSARSSFAERGDEEDATGDVVVEEATVPRFADAASTAGESTNREGRSERPELAEHDARDAGDRVYLPALAHCETTLARNLGILLASAPVRALANPATLHEVERHLDVELHELQRAAVLGLLSTPVGLLTGGPGVGKTTIVRAIVALAHAAHARVLLASPTGRAAKRLAEATGHDAQTVHRLLGYEPQTESFLHDARNPIEADLVIIDEISMLDVVLAHHLVKAIQPPTRVIFVGDPNQLPSVGPGNVLHDMLASGVIPTFRLTQIYRQAQNSLIVTNAHRILQGELPLVPERGDRGADFYFFQADDPAACARRLVEVVTERIPRTFGLKWLDDVQVIAPMYRGECGVDALNMRLRSANDGGSAQREIRQGTRIWRQGDRVINTRNNYDKEVFNGDMGRIAQIHDDASLLVKFPEREVVYTGAELSQLQPAFAITVHRSQGGEFPAVVVPLVTQHFMMLQRNLLYTAITRARRLVVLVGSQQALRMAVENAEQGLRESALAERLRSAAAPS